MSSPSALANSINDIGHAGVYAESIYALSATGGFTMERGFDDIVFREADAIARYDVTDAVQILFDVATFNAKLGLVKDASNNNVVSSTFEYTSCLF